VLRIQQEMLHSGTRRKANVRGVPVDGFVGALVSTPCPFHDAEHFDDHVVNDDVVAQLRSVDPKSPGSHALL
jgi:hypothetical protein